MGIRPTVSVHRSQNLKLPKRAPRPKGVKVGFPAGKTSSDIVERAIWNHFGTETIPERPFLSLAMRNNQAKYRRQMRIAAMRILMSQEPDEQMALELHRLGIEAVNDIKAEIVDLTSPPNAPSTIRQKGSSNPLINSGQLHNAVTWEIDNG